MNPLNWKFEHQVALMICAGVGFVFGFMFGLHEVSRSASAYSLGCDYNAPTGAFACHSIDFYWAVVAMIGVFGAFIGAAIIYAAQLMRR